MAVDSRPLLPLHDRYARERGRVHLTGLQSLVRLPLDAVRQDRAAGRRTAAFVSGYPGSPLAGLEGALRAAEPLLAAHDVRLVPGLNEELAVGAVAGSQLLELFPHSKWDGVVGIWYGKAPGLDRALDALRHASFAGSAHFGGALAVVGDDPSCKSSSLPSHSEHAFAHAFVPVLAPADAAEVLALGLAGIALSRYASVWVGLKVVADVADGGAIFELALPRAFELPKFETRGQPFVRRLEPRLLPPYSSALEEEIVFGRLEAARRFAYANGLDTILMRHARDRVGIAASGRLFRELESALHSLGLGAREQEQLGIRLYCVRMPWPLEPRRAREFADGLDEVIVVDERRGFLEDALRASLYDAQERPLVLGQFDEHREPWLARHAEITQDTLALDLGLHLARRLGRPELAARAEALRARAPATLATGAPRREPHFCSGCPHSTSTRLPEGSVAGGGIGCHTMALLMDRGVQYLGAMGTEGSHWIGLAPYVDTPHLFQNIGDGTYFHSGRLAVRACVEAGVRVTFKLLYNGTIAMTGGQHPVGAKALAGVVHDLLGDGVRRVVVMTEDAEVRALAARGSEVEVTGRAGYDDAMRRLREEPGTTALVYDQLCANEKQRRERRGLRPRPQERVAIHADVCEGCGDCGAKSTCASLWPVATPLGRKTRVHEGSCSDDRACFAGDCPSFMTVRTGPARRTSVDALVPAALPAPPAPRWHGDRWSLYLVGIGSTGVVTVDALLVRAAEIDGLYARHLDQTGLAQRGGKVVSHCVLSRAPFAGSPRVGSGEADAALAFDPLGAADETSLLPLHPARTRAVVNEGLHPTGDMVSHAEHATTDTRALVESIRARSASAWSLPAEAIAEAAFGEPLLANVILLGAALQHGLVPLSVGALEQAVRDRGIAVDANLAALRLGRALAHDSALGARVLADASPPSIGEGGDPDAARARLGLAWDRFDEAVTRWNGCEGADLLRHRAAALACDLADYHDRAYAERYLGALAPLARAESEATPRSTAVTDAAARELYRLMAYKDEYEVARLLLYGPWRRWLERRHEGPLKITYHLHPPLLRALGLRRKLALGRWVEPLLRALAASKRLRGTPLDPFGFSRARSIERELVRWYEAVLAEISRALAPENAALAREIAAAPETLRGFEEVKLSRVDAVRASVDEKLARMRGS